MRITEKIKKRALGLLANHSVAEVAGIIGCSCRSVTLIIKESGFSRTRDEHRAIRSRIRKKQIADERRRIIFGLDQKTDLKVFSNKDKIKLRNLLKRRNYIFLKRGDNVAYFNSNTIRSPAYEERGVKVGLKFLMYQTLQNSII